MSPAITSALQANMHDSSFIFASAVEPNTRVGRLRGTILGTELSSDGTSLVDSVEASDTLGMHLGAEGIIVHTDPPLARPRTPSPAAPSSGRLAERAA